MKALILSGVAWNSTIQRHHMMAKWLKKLGYDVYFVEGLTSSSFSVKKILSKLFSKKNNTINNDKVVNVFSGKFLPPNKVFNKINDLKINKLLNNIPNEYDLVINYLPIYTTNKIIDSIKYNRLIYDCVRDFSNWGGYPSNIISIEKDIIKKSDIILSDSYYLTNKLNSFQILPCIDKEVYKIYSSNNRAVNKIKDIVYFGQIDKHIDINLLNKLSHKYNIHLYGSSNIDLNFKHKNHGYINDKNTLAKELIKYDAIIIPYIGNMNGVIPAKLMQSLATNLPVFISAFYDSEILSDKCYVYKSHNDLIKIIREYKYDKKRSEKIKKFVLENIEENQFIKFKEYIHEKI